MDFVEHDDEYFDFVYHEQPSLETIPESSSCHHSSSYNHYHHYHNHHHKYWTRVRFLKYLSILILQYAVLSVVFQYQWNLQHPPTLPPEYYQLDDDAYMHKSFLQASKPPEATLVTSDDSKKSIITTIDGTDTSSGSHLLSISTTSAKNGTTEREMVPNEADNSLPSNDSVSDVGGDGNETLVHEEPPQEEGQLRMETAKPTAKVTQPTVHENPQQKEAQLTIETAKPTAKVIQPTVHENPPQKEAQLTIETAKPTAKVIQPTVPLNLLPRTELHFYDYFSDSWLITKDNFLQLNTTAMGHPEQACFQAIRKPNFYIHPTSKMFVDWTDFMVEHMSKWWGVFRIARDDDPTMFKHVVDILDNYLMKQSSAYNDELDTSHEEISSLPPLHRTLAMIAFREYQTGLHPARGPILSSHVLAATLASLIPMGFGRILMVGYDPDDRTRVFEALEIIEASYKGAAMKHPKHSNFFSLTLGSTEFAYAKIPKEHWVKTRAYDSNVPRGALRGVQLAVQGNLTELEAHGTTIEEWLGMKYDASYWKYFYLTEPDTILHTKQELLPSMREGLDRGLSFFPHRLQPIPHEHDLPVDKIALDRRLDGRDRPSWELPYDEQQESKHHDNENSHPSRKHFSDRYAGMYLPANVPPFSNITILDSKNKPEEYHCCDGGKGWPGRSEEFGTDQNPCNGKSWWACGFVGEGRQSKSADRVQELHKRLIPYPLMSLEQGTGVIFGPTNAGRRCFPSHSPCPNREVHVLPAS
ncbi:unnamed protein product [Cylindrotheca closterium]|uniref:Uncharacterized protein n=1 Tax=Cylindrotheca closterium TaxID=2856 RepID=A0AAD2G907_9STRA|nr:unnamed protein product [Cylindrotheca closterium]